MEIVSSNMNAQCTVTVSSLLNIHLCLTNKKEYLNSGLDSIVAIINAQESNWTTAEITNMLREKTKCCQLSLSPILSAEVLCLAVNDTISANQAMNLTRLVFRIAAQVTKNAFHAIQEQNSLLVPRTLSKLHL